MDGKCPNYTEHGKKHIGQREFVETCPSSLTRLSPTPLSLLHPTIPLDSNLSAPTAIIVFHVSDPGSGTSFPELDVGVSDQLAVWVCGPLD